MARQETSTGYNPDHQQIEPQLSQSELGKYAHQLIEGFTQALKTTPEFLSASADQNFEDDNIVNVVFKKGDSTYRIQWYKKYDDITGKGIARLYIDKRSLDAEERYNQWRSSLSSYTKNKRETFEDGRIHISHYISNYTNDTDKVFSYENLPTAVQRTQEFLTTNFGQPRPQIPPQQ